MGQPAFWGERAVADEKIKLLGELKDVVDRYRDVERAVAGLQENFDENKFYETKRKFRIFELAELFKELHDRGPAIIGVYPGVGGDDAEDWARILFEMYQKYAAKCKWQIAVLDENPHRRTMEIKGEYAYGYLKGESGVHRLVRVSPFSVKQLRHTSFALVEVLPVLPKLEEEKLQIPESDLKLEFFRASGPG
ncbi:MAG: PCRF domain-containing protein, partial [Patescibacteria group bacterium]